MEWKCEPMPASYDPDRKVTLTIGQLVNALADALKVVEDAPRWGVGDRAYVEVEVTGGGGNNVNVAIVGVAGNQRGVAVPSEILKEIA